MTTATIMRAKMHVRDVQSTATSERLALGAVCKSTAYPPDCTDEDNTFAKWMPSAELMMTPNNPALLGKFKAGDEFYGDFMPADQAR